jgi:hypothetical protein
MSSSDVGLSMRRATLTALVLVACTSATPPAAQDEQPVEPVPGEGPPAPAPPVHVEPPATAPTPTVAPTPALAAAKNFPKNVFAAGPDTWTERPIWSVDIVDFGIKEGSAVDKAFAEMEAAHTDEDGGFLEHTVLPKGHPAIPKGWKVGDTWTLIARDGTTTKKVTGFSATFPAGSGTYHFNVELGPAKKSAKGPAIAIRGEGMTPTLAKPEPLAVDVLGEGALAKIAAALPRKLEPWQRATLRKHPLAAKHVEVLAGRFPGGRTHAIFVHIEADADSEDGDVSELLFAHDDGSIAQHSISPVAGTFTPFAIIDLDGDGLDELVYEDAYHEGWYFQLLWWKDDKPKVRTLTGDGV